VTVSQQPVSQNPHGAPISSAPFSRVRTYYRSFVLLVRTYRISDFTVFSHSISHTCLTAHRYLSIMDQDLNNHLDSAVAVRKQWVTASMIVDASGPYFPNEIPPSTLSPKIDLVHFLGQNCVSVYKSKQIHFSSQFSESFFAPRWHWLNFENFP